MRRRISAAELIARVEKAKVRAAIAPAEREWTISGVAAALKRSERYVLALWQRCELPAPSKTVGGSPRWAAGAIEPHLKALGWSDGDEHKKHADAEREERQARLRARRQRRALLAAMTPEERRDEARRYRQDRQRERYAAMTPAQRQAHRAARHRGVPTDERDLVDFAAEIAVPAIAIGPG
jgi:hypothetical protein